MAEVDYEDGVRWLRHPVSKPFGKLRMSALAEACSRGSVEEVRDLLEDVMRREDAAESMAAELKAQDDWAGSSPLHWAAFAERGAECVEMLLARGADANLPNGRDASLPIHLGARYGRLDSVKILVASPFGCEVDAPNGLGNTALHECAFQGHPETAEELCKMSADLERQNVSGLTPLLAAVQSGKLEVLQVRSSTADTAAAAPLAPRRTPHASTHTHAHSPRHTHTRARACPATSSRQVLLGRGGRTDTLPGNDGAPPRAPRRSPSFYTRKYAGMWRRSSLVGQMRRGGSSNRVASEQPSSVVGRALSAAAAAAEAEEKASSGGGVLTPSREATGESSASVGTTASSKDGNNSGRGSSRNIAMRVASSAGMGFQRMRARHKASSSSSSSGAAPDAMKAARVRAPRASVAGIPYATPQPRGSNTCEEGRTARLSDVRSLTPAAAHTRQSLASASTPVPSPRNHAKPCSGFALSFVVPNEGALSLAFTAGSLPIINELLLHRWRRRELPSKARHAAPRRAAPRRTRDVGSNPLRSPLSAHHQMRRAVSPLARGSPVVAAGCLPIRFASRRLAHLTLPLAFRDRPSVQGARGRRGRRRAVRGLPRARDALPRRRRRRPAARGDVDPRPRRYAASEPARQTYPCKKTLDSLNRLPLVAHDPPRHPSYPRRPAPATVTYEETVRLFTLLVLSYAYAASELCPSTIRSAHCSA